LHFRVTFRCCPSYTRSALGPRPRCSSSRRGGPVEAGSGGGRLSRRPPTCLALARGGRGDVSKASRRPAIDRGGGGLVHGRHPRRRSALPRRELFLVLAPTRWRTFPRCGRARRDPRHPRPPIVRGSSGLARCCTPEKPPGCPLLAGRAGFVYPAASTSPRPSAGTPDDGRSDRRARPAGSRATISTSRDLQHCPEMTSDAAP